MGEIVRGHISSLRSHKGFMGAEDIEHLCPLTVRLVDTKTYQPGERPMGRKLDDVMSTAILDIRGWVWKDGKKILTDKYSRAPKEWILNAGIQSVLKYRYGFELNDRRGKEFELYVDVCKAARGGQTFGVRICPSPLDNGMTHEQIHEHLLSLVRYKPPPPAQVFEDIEDDKDGETTTPRDRFDAGASWAE